MFVRGHAPTQNPRRPRAWANADDPDNVSGLGDTTTGAEPAVISNWRAQVAMLKPFYKYASGKVAQGQAVVVRMPSSAGANKGQLGYKYPSPQQPGNTVTAFTYTLAPGDVRAADVALGAQIDSSKTNWATDVDQGVKLTGEAVQRLATGTAEAIGKTAGAAGKGIGEALGIPAWLVPVGLGAAGLFLLRTLAPQLWPFGGRR